jgi:transposase
MMWPDFALVQTLVFASVQETVRMAQGQVLTGAERRRRWSDEQKRAIVAAASAPGAVIADVARLADVCSSLIYRWRRQFVAARPGFSEVIIASVNNGDGPPGDKIAAPFVQSPEANAVTAPSTAVDNRASAIEVAVDGPGRVRIPASISPELAAAVVAALVRR